MATNLNTILEWFKTGKKPTEDQFRQSWTSFWHKDETIPQSSVNNLTTVLNAKAEKSQFDFHKTDPNAHGNLIIRARIYPVGQLQIFKVAPNANEEAQEVGDYCIGIVEDTFINGTWNGGDPSLKSSYE